MSTNVNFLKQSIILKTPEEINHFIEKEGNKYGLKPIPDYVPPKDRIHPPIFVFKERIKRDPTLADIAKELSQLTDGQLTAREYREPVLAAIADCERQRNALIAFYNEANGKRWYRHDNWCCKSVSMGDWYGVTTRSKFIFAFPHRRPLKVEVVTRLELSHNNIYRGRMEQNGYISSRIGDLKDLEVLNLSRNFICGKIPDRLWELTNLRELGLHFNQLEGKISPKIGRLTQLRRVQLDHNHLTGSIPDSIGNLKNLQGLFLHVNDLDSYWRTYMLLQLNKGKETIEKRTLKLPLRYQTPIPASIGNLTHLKEFYAYSNQLYGKIPTAVKNNPNFKNWLLNPQQDGVKLT